MRIPRTTLMTYIGFIFLLIGCFAMTAIVSQQITSGEPVNGSDFTGNTTQLVFILLSSGFLLSGIVLVGIGFFSSLAKLSKVRKS